ncbi:biopolymer transporter ExbD [Paracoccus aurantiacus]|uniref:Biopolymer transporter ExbD n=1 Tax=Paracoccus aurantiacus TaxID=2599412 RepID=A0A5C6S9Y4_9RHOB|nr:biopolymer transporter ExbD [Paracoccus aurantiacus]TXB71194.1 biopolymer transporter ExbD [Paracoccus aurantiacus]
MALNLPARRTERAHIDTSLSIVNIVLLLLFFFIIVGQAARPQPGIDLSQTTDLPLEQLPSPILLVDADGEWLLDGQPISPELLPAAMTGGAGQVLHLMIDRDAPASLLVDALNDPVLADYDLRLVTLNERVTP